MESSEIVRAVKDPSNFKPIVFCSAALTGAGMVMIIFGIVILMIDHNELGPPRYDNQYERYSGSSSAHIIGPMLIAFGSLTIVVNTLTIAYATRCYFIHNVATTTSASGVKKVSSSRTTSGYKHKVNEPLSKRRQEIYVSV